MNGGAVMVVFARIAVVVGSMAVAFFCSRCNDGELIGALAAGSGLAVLLGVAVEGFVGYRMQRRAERRG